MLYMLLLDWWRVMSGRRLVRYSRGCGLFGLLSRWSLRFVFSFDSPISCMWEAIETRELQLMIDPRSPSVHYHDSCLEYYRNYSIWILRVCSPRRRHPNSHLGQVSLPTWSRSWTNPKVQPIHDPIPNRSIIRSFPISINLTTTFNPIRRSYYILLKPSFARTSLPTPFIEDFFDQD